MDVRIVDLDGSVTQQTELLRRYRPRIMPARDWGPSLRLACRFARFRHFRCALASQLGSDSDQRPAVTLYGSGDFHHVSLALLHRQPGPFNLLLIDNHPDWMHGVPLLHCGTWLAHAARLPQMRLIFHVGGDVDFDNPYRWVAPWKDLCRRKIVVLPAIRSFSAGRWRTLPTPCLRPRAEQPVDRTRLAELLKPYQRQLAQFPLYISVDKDVMKVDDAVVNWDSGHLRLDEVSAVIAAFLGAAGGRLAAADLVGDWSPVELQGRLRRILHRTEHPRLQVDKRHAKEINERANLACLDLLHDLTVTGQESGPGPQTAGPYAAAG